jgi:hypothetical protein
MPDSDKIELGAGSDMALYHDGTNSYITNKTGALKIGDTVSAIAISIGHTTSEVTVNDNLTVTGNFTVNGTTTTVNSTTLTVDDKLIELAHSPSGSEGDDTAIDGGGIILKSSDSDKSIVWTDATDSWDFNQNGIFAGILKTDSTTDATTKTDGSLQTDGGLSVAKAIYNGTAATLAADSGIVTIGSTTAATFSAIGFLNINNATDATSATDGSLQTDGGLSVVKDILGGNDLILLSDSAVIHFGLGKDVTLTHTNDVGLHLNAGMRLAFRDQGGEYLTSASDGHLEVNAGTTLDITAPTVDINASTGVTIDTDTVTIASANSTDPVMVLKNTNTDANAARLRFVKDAGEAGADGDDIGVIEFYGDDTAQTQTVFAKIVAEISESDHTDEAGKLSFYVAESDGTDTALAAGLVLEGEHSTNGEVDVTIGAGTASTTTVAGNLTVTGDLTITGDDLYMNTNTDKFILVANGTNFNPVESTGDVIISNDGSSAIQANAVDGTHIALGSDAQGDVMYYDGTNWARLGYGTSGFFLKTQGSSANPAWAESNVLMVEVVASANVTISKGYTAISTAGSNRTATLPEATAATVGDTYTVKKTDSGAGNVQVTAEGSGLIDGGASIVLYHQFESATVVCRAADVWDII